MKQDWENTPLEAQAHLIAYSQIRELEEAESNAALMGGIL